MCFNNSETKDNYLKMFVALIEIDEQTERPDWGTF